MIIFNKVNLVLSNCQYFIAFINKKALPAEANSAFAERLKKLSF